MKWVWVAIAIYIVIFGVVTSLRHYNFQTQAWDLGIFDQVVWNISRGNGMSTTLEFVQNHFAVHMSPILFLLAPGYLVFPSPYFLLILQTIALALGAWPLYLLAKKVLFVKSSTSDKIPLAITTAYLLYPSLHWVNWFDFHPIAFLVPAFLAAFYFAEKRRWGLMSLFLILAASAQEDAVLVVAFFGIYLIFKKEWKIGLTIFLLSILYFLLSIKFIMPYFGGGLLRIDRYAQLGGSFSEIAKNFFIHPSLFISTIFQWQKLIYLFWLFLPVAFLPLLAPREWILLIPGIAQNLLTNYAPQFASAYQYDSALIAGIFIAAIYGLKKAIGLFAGFAAATPRAPTALRRSREESKKTNGFLVIGLATIVLLAFFIRSPISPFNFPAELFKKSEQTYAFQKMIERVPENASVAAHTQIVPHLSQREKIYMLGYEPALEPDIILIDGSDYFGFGSPEFFASHIQKYADSGKYSVEILNNRYYILKKK